MLELQNISLTLGQKILFNHASARIGNQYRVGLIGRNGTGKSTLIKIILGEVHPDNGQVSLHCSKQKIAYLEQSLPNSNLSILEYAKTGDAEWLFINQSLNQAIDTEDGIAIANCHARLEEIDGYTLDARAAKILAGLGFSNQQQQQPVTQFSGGWQMRLQLARVLLSRGDLLLLDEPTNHLDIDAIIWLEQWLQEQTCTLMIISHDRDFLDNVCNYSLYLSQEKLTLYTGNYSAFSEQYAMQCEQQSKQQAKIIAKRAHMQDFVDRFKAKATKARQAQSRVKALEKLTLSATALTPEKALAFHFIDDTKPLKGSLINLDATIGYPDHPIIDSCQINIDYGDRIGLIGKNGQGKTTLIKSLAHKIPLLDGIQHENSKIKIGYFSQNQLDSLCSDATPLESITTLDPRLTEGQARTFLGGFDFSNERVFDRISHFSGGEKARLALALLIYQQPNLLLLDEPTNHLDMSMRDAFIIALQSFTGAMLLVSHDRYFMSSVVNDIWCIEDRKIQIIAGDLDDYKQSLLQKTKVTSTKPASIKKSTKSIDFKKIKKLENEISKIQIQLNTLEEQLTDNSLYQADKKSTLDDVLSQHKALKEKIAKLEEQWISLNQ